MDTKDTIPKPDDKGEFVRVASSFRNWVTADGSSGGFPVASGRYHLYVSLACPWSCRTLVARALKGLEDAISVTVVDPRMGDKGWVFTDKFPRCKLDPINEKETMREVYQIVEEGYSGRVTVPVLWDKEKKTIVNNESSEILRMLGTGVFNEFSATQEQRDLNLYPEHLQTEIDEINDYIYPNLNNGVYRAGFATTQEVYLTAVTGVFEVLDKLEDHLSTQRYLVGNILTEADIRLAMTLFRFDTVYHGLFKCNKKALTQYPNLWGYTRDIYQTPGVADNVDLHHINTGYWWAISHSQVNPTSIVPIGPDLNFNEPHEREKLALGQTKPGEMD